MKVRRLTVEDAEYYRKMRLQALKEHPEAFSSSYEEEGQYSLDVYKDRFQSNNSLTLGAFEKGVLIGTVTLLVENKLKLRHRASIVAMYVAPKYRKKRVGHTLMTEAIKIAKEKNGIEQIYLSVEAMNTPAKKLYSSFGFEVYGLEKRALKIGDNYFDEEHMVLFLS